MLVQLLNLLHYLFCYVAWFFIFFHPERKGNRLSRPVLSAIFFGYGALQSLLCLIVMGRYAQSVIVLNNIKIAGFLLVSWLPFYAFPKKAFENLFILGLCGMFFAVSIGFGNVTEWLLYAQPLWLRRLLNVLVTGLISLLLLPTFLGPINQMFRSWQGEESAVMWKSFWMIPCAFVAMVLTCGNYTQPGSVVRAEFVISRVIICINLYLLFYYINTVMRQSARTAALSERARLTEQQLSLQREQYAQLSEQIEKSRAARHDLRHQLTVLKGYADSADWGGMGDYLSEYIKTLPLQEEAYCPHYAVNALARHYGERAEAEAVPVDFRLQVPEEIGDILDADLSVVMGNCLENALRACGQLSGGARWIHLRMWVHDGSLILWMRNAAPGKQPTSKAAQVTQTRTIHGVGLSSIEAIAGKYGGEASFWAEEDAFESLVLMPLYRRARSAAGQ